MERLNREDSESFGLVGCGRMGSAIASQALNAGISVTVYDVAPEASEPLRSLGAYVAGSPAEVAQRSLVTMVIVVDDLQTREAITGDRGVLEGAGSGSVVAVGTSVHPRTCVELHREAADRNVDLIDTALVGGERGAEQGGLTLMCGGPLEAIDRGSRVFSAFATSICHVGPPGSGQVAKAANNALMWAAIRIDVEALRIARGFGVSPGVMRSALRVGTGSNQPLSDWGLHRLRWPLKDLQVASEMAKEAGVDAPLIESLGGWMEGLSVDDLNDLR